MKTAFFFTFSLYNMVDSENSPENYKCSKISIGVIIKHPEMLRYVFNYPKTKKMCKIS